MYGRHVLEQMAFFQRLVVLRRAGLQGSFQRADCPRQANGYDCGVYVLGECLVYLPWVVSGGHCGISADCMLPAQRVQPR